MVYWTLDVSYSWTTNSAGSMDGVTYASGVVYNVGTMCPSNVNQGYACDGRNIGTNYLNPNTVSSFCSDHIGTSTQYGFGHGVSSSQTCGQCAQIRVARESGGYNYMTVMMVDRHTASMEVGTTEIQHLLEDTGSALGDRLDFDFRIVNGGDCYASFDDDASSSPGSPSDGRNTPSPTTSTSTSTESSPTDSSSGGSSSGCSSDSSCSVSSNWGLFILCVQFLYDMHTIYLWLV